MHQVIRAIVYAKNKEEALEEAKEIFEGLCENQNPFDYYTTFDEDSPVSGKARWGNLPVVALASSKEGKKLIEEGLKATKEDFYDHLRKIRAILRDNTNQQLWKDDFDLFRYHCYAIGMYRGSSIWLYDSDGEGIRDKRHLENVLNKWNSKEYKDLKVYVVPADVHF